MTLSMRRIVLFTKDMPGWSLYRDVLGLKLGKDEKGLEGFGANGCVIACTTALPRWPRPQILLGQGHRRRRQEQAAAPSCRS